jgi:S1-C subfamily serine protease
MRYHEGQARRVWGYLRIALVLSVLLALLSASVSKGAYERLQGQQGETRQQLSVQQAEETRLRTDFYREQAKVADLATRVAALGEQVTDAKAQLSEAQSHTADLETKVTSIIRMLEEEEAETYRLASELSRAKDINLSLMRQVDSLKAELLQVQAANARLLQQTEALGSQVGVLQSLASRQTADSQSLAQVISLTRPAIVRVKTPAKEGTGFFFDKEGHILTNAHVVGSASSVTIVVDDSLSLAGQVVGRDEVMDVAVVKVVLGRDATFLTLGDSNKAEIGSEVLALGYPLGTGSSGCQVCTLGGQATVTKGVLSARRQDGSTMYLQTDAPINPGNSGGPLLSHRGDVIGINTLKVVQIGGTTYEGIGFAISINSVKSILSDLMAGSVVNESSTG